MLNLAVEKLDDEHKQPDTKAVIVGNRFWIPREFAKVSEDFSTTYNKDGSFISLGGDGPDIHGTYEINGSFVVHNENNAPPGKDNEVFMFHSTAHHGLNSCIIFLCVKSAFNQWIPVFPFPGLIRPS